ncbi:MAG: exodeoxyribonuclease VII small subunit [Rikenellaceae bacterium]|nr:exodeoxyribonuclease VII small subunit [Rikenellaceae bacterium]
MAEITEMSYKEAIEEIEKILRSLREEQNSIDTLSERVARATELIALCRERLRRAESEVNKIIEE